MTDYLTNGLLGCLIAAAAVLLFGAGSGIVRAFYRTSKRGRAAITGAAKVLAAEPGSRLNVNGWADVLFDLQRGGLTLKESLALVKSIRLFWRIPPGA